MLRTLAGVRRHRRGRRRAIRLDLTRRRVREARTARRPAVLGAGTSGRHACAPRGGRRRRIRSGARARGRRRRPLGRRARGSGPRRRRQLRGASGARWTVTRRARHPLAAARRVEAPTPGPRRRRHRGGAVARASRRRCLDPARQHRRRRPRLGLTKDRKASQRLKTQRPEGEQPQPQQQRDAHRAARPPQHPAPAPRLVDQDLRGRGSDAAHASETHQRPEGWVQTPCCSRRPPRRRCR